MPVFKFYKQDNSILNFIEFSTPFNFYSIEHQKMNVRFGTTSFDDINNNFQMNVKTGHGPLPVAVRYIDNAKCLIERPPFQITLDYSPTRSGGVRRSVKPVKIWIPWTVTVLDYHYPTNFNDYKIYFNYQPITSLDDDLLLPYVSNVFNDGRVCLGQSSQRISAQVSANPDVMSCYYSFFNEVFSGGWNADISPSVSTLLHTANSQKNNYIISSIYYPPQITEEIQPIIRKNKIKFYKSTHTSFSTANFYYNLSLLSLEETLEVVKNAIEHPGSQYKMKPSSLLHSQSHSSSNVLYVHDPSVYSSCYASINLVITDSTYALSMSKLNELYTHSYAIRNKHKTSYYYNFISYLENNIESIFDEIYSSIKEGKISINVKRTVDILSKEEIDSIFSKEEETV